MCPAPALFLFLLLLLPPLLPCSVPQAPSLPVLVRSPDLATLQSRLLQREGRRLVGGWRGGTDSVSPGGRGGPSVGAGHYTASGLATAGGAGGWPGVAHKVRKLMKEHELEDD